MELPTLPIQEEILLTIHNETNLSKIHSKLDGMIDEYGWQYPHYLMVVDFNHQKRNKNYFLDMLDFLKDQPNLLSLEKKGTDNIFLIEQDEYIKPLVKQENFFIGAPSTTHLLPTFLNMYSKYTHSFDISQINWLIEDSKGYTPFFYAIQFECQYFLIKYIEKDIPFFTHITDEQVKEYEKMIEKNDIPNKPLVNTLFEKYKLEAIIQSNIETNKKYKI